MSEKKTDVPNPLENKGEETQAIRPAAGVHQIPPLPVTYQPGEYKLNDGTVRSDH